MILKTVTAMMEIIMIVIIIINITNRNNGDGADHDDVVEGDVDYENGKK